MKLKLDTNIGTTALLLAIFSSIFYILFWLYLATPFSKPPLFWLSFLLWFLLGFLGFLLADDNEHWRNLVIFAFCLLLMPFAAGATYSDFMFTVTIANEGWAAGYGTVLLIYLTKRLLDRKRGLPAQPTRPLSEREKDAYKLCAYSVISVVYLFIAYRFNVLGYGSFWYWVLVILYVLWWITLGWFAYKYRSRFIIRLVTKYSYKQRIVVTLFMIGIILIGTIIGYMAVTGQNIQLTTAVDWVYWGLVIVINVMIGYVFFRAIGNLQNNRMKLFGILVILLDISLMFLIFPVFFLPFLTGLIPW